VVVLCTTLRYYHIICLKGLRWIATLLNHKSRHTVSLQLFLHSFMLMELPALLAHCVSHVKELTEQLRVAVAPSSCIPQVRISKKPVQMPYVLSFISVLLLSI
jgi:hypothetical protein